MSTIHNPQFDEFVGGGFVTHDRDAIFKMPEITALRSNYVARHTSNTTYAFSIVCPNVLAMVAKYAKSVIDFGAGTGYWGYLLTQMGIEYLGIDDYSWHGMTPVEGDGSQKFKVGHWHKIKSGGINQLNRAQSRYDALLLAWPPYDTGMGYLAASCWKGRYLFYSGEGYGGCTGNDEFHDLLETAYREIDGCAEYNWPGLHSAFTVYERA